MSINDESNARRQARKNAEPYYENDERDDGGRFIAKGKPAELPHRFNTTNCDDPTSAQSDRPAFFDDAAALEAMMGEQATEGFSQSDDTDDARDGEAPSRSRA